MMPASIVRSPATIRMIHIVMWMPTRSLSTRRPEVERHPLKCWDASQPAVYAPTA